MILAIRTDNPEAELYLLKDDKQIAKKLWLAERRLAIELLPKITELLNAQDIKLEELTGLIVFTGEGSFTGLRIGTTVANTLAYSYSIPIVEAEGVGWLEIGQQKIAKAKPGKYVTPKYSSEPNITKPKT